MAHANARRLEPDEERLPRHHAEFCPVRADSIEVHEPRARGVEARRCGHRRTPESFEPIERRAWCVAEAHARAPFGAKLRERSTDEEIGRVRGGIRLREDEVHEVTSREVSRLQERQETDDAPLLLRDEPSTSDP